MGYWIETCVLTNLPIVDPEEKIVGIYSESLMNFKMHFENPVFILMDRIKVEYGKLDSYGELYDVTESFCSTKLRRKDYIAFMYYDVYKNLAEFYKKKDKEEFRKFTTEFIKNYSIDAQKEYNETREMREDFRAVICALSLSRAGFPENMKRGSQDENIVYRQFIAKQTLKKAKQIEKYKKERDRESNEFIKTIHLQNLKNSLQ